MLSYQHSFHAGNLADVQKHGLLAWMLDYLCQKPKPVTYIETHAGRAIYDLNSAEAQKTGEAAKGIGRAEDWFDPEHPYRRALKHLRKSHGPASYAGSPYIAHHLLRGEDQITLAELHPAEAATLRNSLRGIKVHQQDGFALAHGLLPPTPKRGLMLVDPSYEVKTDYVDIPKHLAKWQRAWNVGIIVIWYPVLITGTHEPMLDALAAQAPEGLRLEVRFPQARPGHGMIGSGLFVTNPPFGLAEEATRLKHHFDQL